VDKTLKEIGNFSMESWPFNEDDLDEWRTLTEIVKGKGASVS
jgi:hypothetical protein